MSNMKTHDLVEVLNLILDYEELRDTLRRKNKIEKSDIQKVFSFARSIKSTIEGIDRIPPMNSCTMEEIEEVEQIMLRWQEQIKLNLLGKLFS